MLAVALLTKTTPISPHEYSRLGTVESLVERGTFQLDESPFIITIDKIHRDGHYYSHQLPLLSVLELPVYWVLRLTGMRFNNSGRLVLTYLFSLLTNGVAFAATIVLFYKIFELLAVERRTRLRLAVLLPCGTWLLPYSLVANNHGISGMLLTLTIYLLLAIERHGISATRCTSLGVTLGILSGIELLPLFSFVPLATIWMLSRPGVTWRHASVYFAGVGAPLVVHAIANVQITGDLIPAGFHHELFNYPDSAFNPNVLTGTVKYTSISDAVNYAWLSLVAGKGYFTFAPVLALGLIVGLVNWQWWSGRRGMHLTLLGGTLLSLGAAIVTTNNFGGEAVGFRHATYLAPAMLMLLMPWIVARGEVSSARTVTVSIVAAISVLSMIVFASPRPWSTLSVADPQARAWGDYLPIVSQVVNGTLLKP